MTQPTLIRGVVQTAAALLLATGIAHAQTATIYGSLGNFDVANDTGEDACGFEVEVQNSNSSAVQALFSWERYGAPKLVDIPGGVRMRYESPLNSMKQCTTKTVAHPVGVPFGGTCYMGSTTYDQSGCEHFGIGFTVSAQGAATAHWLKQDPANPDVLIAYGAPAAIPQPYYYTLPAPILGAQPQVVMQVEAPEPAETPETYGDAQWMRVFIRQMPTEVTLDQLMSDNAIVPQDAAQLESNWQLIQADPPNGNAKRNRNRRQYQGGLDPTTRTVVRRIEMHEYTGTYDPVTHEALCADLTCNAPAADELGQMLSAQMTAVLVQTDSVTVTKSGTGGGNVSSADTLIACGNKCVSPYPEAQAVTLTAQANSGSTFAGWAGACTGTQTTCNVSALGRVQVTATFNAIPKTGGGGGGGGGTTGGSFKLSVGRSNTGTISSDVSGINCGNSCSAAFASGAVVKLTATPAAGKSFVNWTGACTGTAPTCTVTLTKDTSVQAVFTK